MFNSKNTYFISIALALTVLEKVSSLPHHKTLQASDGPNIFTKIRAKRYTIDGNPMKTKDLTYKFESSSKHLVTNEIRADIKQAFEVWSEYTDLTFAEIENEHVNFHIILSESGYVGLASFIDKEKTFGDVEWIINVPIDDQILYTAAHIIGHTLGLGHSDQYALMSPRLHRFKTPFRLPIDDILGIVKLYGPRSNYSE